MSIGSLDSVVSINSTSQSPEQIAIITSPLLKTTQLVGNIAPSQVSRRKLSFSPLPLHHRSVSMTLETQISPSRVGKPRLNHHQHISSLNLDMTKPQSPFDNNVVSENSDIEDSPQLLATSSGTKFGNQLLQSTSNISLLSLSHQLTNNNDSQSTIMMQESESASTLNGNSKQVNVIPTRPFMMQRKGSTQYNTPSSTKSSFNSPALQGTQFINVQARPVIRRPSSTIHAQTIQIQQQQQHYHHQQQQQQQIPPATSTTFVKLPPGRQQPIHIRGSQLDEPDSPPLDPTSLKNSPSKFLLSQSSPPSSLKSNSAFTFNQMPRYPNANIPPRPTSSASLSMRQPTTPNTQQHSQLKALMTKFTEENNDITNLPPAFVLTRENSITDSIGGRSPEFAPVSSTLPPMTPLVLSLPTEFTSRGEENDEYNDESDLEDNNQTSSGGIRSNSVTEDIFGETIDD